MVFSVITALVLLTMAWFDFKYRLIPLWLFIVLAGVFLSIGWSSIPLVNLLLYFSVNVIVLSILIFGVWVWFRLIKHSAVNILDVYLGKGDLLFMLIVGLYFSPVLFVAFQVFSITALLFIFGLYILFAGNSSYPVPLAGGQALLLFVFEVIKPFIPVSVQYRDQFLIQYIFPLW